MLGVTSASLSIRARPKALNHKSSIRQNIFRNYCTNVRGQQDIPLDWAEQNLYARDIRETAVGPELWEFKYGVGIADQKDFSLGQLFFGTRERPVEVPSHNYSRIVGCMGKMLLLNITKQAINQQYRLKFLFLAS